MEYCACRRGNTTDFTTYQFRRCPTSCFNDTAHSHGRNICRQWKTLFRWDSIYIEKLAQFDALYESVDHIAWNDEIAMTMIIYSTGASFAGDQSAEDSVRIL